MGAFVYVDNSNVWIEGMRVSAVEKGIAPDIYTATEQKIVDFNWKLDFGRLHEFAGGKDTAKAVLYGTRPPANDSLWASAKSVGFEVTIYDRNISNREKKIDTTIVRDIIRDSLTIMKPNEDFVVLVAGDSDYVPVAEELSGRNIDLEVVFWDHCSAELKQESTRFVSLNSYLEYLCYKTLI